MYLLAVDRTNERLSDLYRDYHPAVLRVLKRIADGVGGELEHLSVCGDSAANPMMLPFYLGIGIRRFSVAPPRIADLRRRLSGLTLEDSQRISGEMLAIRSIREMEQYLEHARHAVA
jgi:phosphoenolpyruvate-protein kinase (PTS system EI component)